MADEMDETTCEDEKNHSDSDSCESFQDKEEAPDGISNSSKQSSLKDPKSNASKVKEDWKWRFPYLSYRNFLLQVRSVNDKSVVKDPYATASEKNPTEGEELEGIYADDKGYFRGDIFEELESDDNIGFAGDVCKQLNLMPNVDISDHERTAIDDGSLKTDRQTDSGTPEIIVVPSSRFVRELKVEKVNRN